MKHILSLILIFSLFSCKEKKEVSSETSKLFYNGDILTMEDDSPNYAEAIIAQNGKIVFVGTKSEAESKFKDSEKIDLKGKTLLPGFIDPHSHFGMVSNTMGQVDLNPKPVGNVTNLNDILENLKKYKEDKKIPDGEWIFGWGYDDGELTEKRHPTKKDIDKVLPNNPVYLQHTSGHMGVANTLGLEALKVSIATNNPDGGTIVRFPNSADPTGLVQETAMYPFVRLMMEKLNSKQAEFFDTTQDYYASNGITTAQDGMTSRESIKFFQSQADAGKFKIDLIALAGFSELDSNLADTTLHFKTYKNGFKTQGTKIVADGSPQGKQLFLANLF